MKLLRPALKGALVVALSFLFIDAAKAGPAEIESDAGVISMVATVQAIDVTNQVVTLVGPNNNWVEVKVKPEHIKLIKLKERITVSYADEVAVGLRKLNKAPAADSFAQDEEAGMNMNAPTVAEQDWVETTPHGATDLTTIEITDTVAAIDRDQRTITFAGTGGKTRTIAVGPDVQGFNQVAVGDDVALLVTRAVAVDVKPA
jgi:hypothetical protein